MRRVLSVLGAGVVLMTCVGVDNVFGAAPAASRPELRTSAPSRRELFSRSASRRFRRSLSPEQRKRLVALKSRAFVPHTPAEADLDEDGPYEVYLSLERSPSQAERKELSAAGIELLEHVTRRTWRALVPDLRQVVRFKMVAGIEPLLAVDKLSPGLWQAAADEQGADRGQSVDAIVTLDARMTDAELTDLLQGAGVNAAKRLDGTRPRLAVKASLGQLEQLGAHPFVRYAESPEPPNVLHNVDAATLSNVTPLHSAPYSLGGDGIAVCVRDGGRIQAHSDFGSPTRLTIVNDVNASEHATHVAGTIGGDGSGRAAAKGMAPQVLLYSYYYNSGTVVGNVNGALNNYGARLSNHSYGHVVGWGDGGNNWYGNTYLFGNYTSEGAAIDAAVRANELVFVKSAGNDRNDFGVGHPHDGTYDTDGYYDCIASWGNAKNIITVGAVTDSGSMASFSSWGPANDGRIKPDVVANGTFLTSTVRTDSYDSMSGTSMSSPVVCGIMALLMEQYAATNGTEASAAVLKAVLLTTTTDKGRAGPDYKFGWGLANAQAAADLIVADGGPGNQIIEDSLSEGEESIHTLTLAGSDPLRVTLCWTDVEGNPSASDALVNDLDLVLVSPDGTQTNYPYIMPYAVDGSSRALAATTGINEWDNIEQVYVAAPDAGVWRSAYGALSCRTATRPLPWLPAAAFSMRWSQPTRTGILWRPAA